VPLQASVSTQSQCGHPQADGSLLVHDNGGGLGRHLCCCLRGLLDARGSLERPIVGGERGIVVEVSTTAQWDGGGWR
jgi:hypothetical protein